MGPYGRGPLRCALNHEIAPCQCRRIVCATHLQSHFRAASSRVESAVETANHLADTRGKVVAAADNQGGKNVSNEKTFVWSENGNITSTSTSALVCQAATGSSMRAHKLRGVGNLSRAL